MTTTLAAPARCALTEANLAPGDTVAERALAAFDDLWAQHPPVAPSDRLVIELAALDLIAALLEARPGMSVHVRLHASPESISVLITHAGDPVSLPPEPNGRLRYTLCDQLTYRPAAAGSAARLTHTLRRPCGPETAASTA